MHVSRLRARARATSAAPSSQDDPRQRYTAVRDVTLAVGAGEFVSVVGPTGCGKSTLLNVAAGLLAPSSGRGRGVRRAARRHQPARRLHVPDREPDALAHRARQRRWPGSSSAASPTPTPARRRDEWLQRVGLGGFGDRYPHQLSGGMRKRVEPGADAGARPRHHPDGRAVLGARHPDAPADGERGARRSGPRRRRRCSSSPTTSTRRSR